MPAASTYRVSVQTATRMNTAARLKLCASGEPRGSMNCGRNAAKNKAVFGLSSATQKPSRKARPRAPACASRAARSRGDAAAAVGPLLTHGNDWVIKNMLAAGAEMIHFKVAVDRRHKIAGY